MGVNLIFLQLWHESAVEKSELLLKQLLFGLSDAAEEALEGLKKSSEELFEKTKDLNDKKIKLKCSETQRKVEV